VSYTEALSDRYDSRFAISRYQVVDHLNVILCQLLCSR
jgi:hypothetical protein